MDLERLVAGSPLRAVAIAAGVGFLTGLLLAGRARREPERVRETED